VIAYNQHQGVLGDWSCKCGSLKYKGTEPLKSSPCVRCGSHPTNYGEIALFDHELKIIGNPDFPFLFEDGYVVTEIKSIKSDGFKELTAPLADHVLQAALYHYLLELNGYPVHNTMIVIYATKDYTPVQAYKEYHVDVSPEKRNAIIKHALDNRRSMLAAINSPNKALPAKLQSCRTPEDLTAKNCAYCNLCFSWKE
jgi:hypothetical protein